MPLRDWFRRRRGDAPGPAHRFAVRDIQAWVRAGLTEVAGGHGFRVAIGSENGWVRPCCDGALQVIQLTWVTRFSEVYVIAGLAFAYQLVDSEKLWAEVAGELTPEYGYSENLPSLRKTLQELLPSRDFKDWKFPRDALPRALLDDMGRVVERWGLPFLTRFRSREEVLAEIEREHAALKRPSVVGELRLSCHEFCSGERDRAVSRVERALATLPPDAAGEVTAGRRRAATRLLDLYRSGQR